MTTKEKKYKAVLFDMDGTLIDSMNIWVNIDIEFLGERNIDIPKTLANEIQGLSFTQTAVYFKDRFNLTEPVEKIEEIWNGMAYEKYKNSVRLKDGVFDFLSYLKSRGIKAGIGTSNSKLLTDAVLDSLDISGFFSGVLTNLEVKNGKPSPDIYLKLSELLDVSPDDCLVCEDMPAGLTAAKRAGMDSCAVWDWFSEHLQNEKRMLSNYYIKDFGELMRMDLF